MLEEVVNASQVPGEGFRRWFSDTQADLFVWEDDGRNIVGFQLCYGKGADEHAFTWRHSGGFRHNKIDDGEDPEIGHKSSPILVPDGQFNPSALSKYFLSRSNNLDSKVVAFVCEKLASYEKDEYGV